mgnify:FL=1
MRKNEEYFQDLSDFYQREIEVEEEKKKEEKRRKKKKEKTIK